MKVEQLFCDSVSSLSEKLSRVTPNGTGLVLVFGDGAMLKNDETFDGLRKAYPNASLLGCSTAGEIAGTRVVDGSLVVTAIEFEHTQVRGASVAIEDPGDSREAGRELGRQLSEGDPVHVFLLSDGLNVNGSDLTEGLLEELPGAATVTGGLSGDGDRFTNTSVLWDQPASSNRIAAVGLYGERLKVGYGSMGGWDSFGPERVITKSTGNVLYELDGQSALELYKKYLGEHADGLPATGLLFPLSIRTNGDERAVVRTILAVDEASQSLTFAGDVPEGSYARLMKANFDRLIDGAAGAAMTSYEAIGSTSADLAILISCVGRKMILGQRVEEEVESVREVLGEKTVMTGFYSYGEISPFTPGAKCELHNQTMTITTLSER